MMEAQAALRIGLVGCGWHGRNMAEAISRSESLRLVACADPDEAAASHASAVAPDVSTHSSIEALLADREVDAIVVATPHHLLAPVTLAALRSGKHVLAEKPMALSEREAAEIEHTAVQSGVCYMPGYSMRFSMGRHVHDLLSQGVVGEICAITGEIGCPPLTDGWIAYPETGGGVLLFLGSHLVDLILWCLADDPVETFATIQERAETGADNTSAFQVRFARGAVAQCLVTQAASTFFYGLSIHGDTGKVALKGHSFINYEIEVSSNKVTAYREPTFIRPLVWRDNISHMLVPELEEFASAIREKRMPMVTMTDGRRTLQILDAVKESGITKSPVVLQQR